MHEGIVEAPVEFAVRRTKSDASRKASLLLHRRLYASSV